MPSVTQSPINVVAGQQTQVATPNGIPYGTIAVVIYNSTSSILQVISSSGSQFLQPLQADVYRSSPALPAPQVTPLTLLPAGTYLGTITAAFFDTNDGYPVGFPQPLSAFPGGNLVIGWQIANSLNSHIAFPNGTGIVTLILVAGPGIGSLKLIGDQTGTQYLGSNPSGDVITWIFNLTGSIDTSYQFTYLHLFGLGQLVTFYAAPSTPVPAYVTTATALVDIHTNPTTVLAAPSNGANYLFEVDLVLTGGGPSIVSISANGGEIAAAVLEISAAGTPSNGSVTIPLGPFRATTAVTAMRGVASSFALIRYAPGP